MSDSIGVQYPHHDEFDNEWLCPYCVAPTRPEDRTCSACRNPLIVRTRVKEERTVWLWRGIHLQFVVALFLAALGAAAFTLILKFNGVPSPVPFLPLYFGLPVDQPQNLNQTVLAAFPLWAFWGLLGAILYSLGLLLILYWRVPYGHFLYLVNGSIMLVVSVAGLLFFYDSGLILAASVIGLFLSAAQLAITMNLWNDFTFNEGRLRLKIDHDAKNHASLFLSARKYSQAALWGLAVIHLRRAVARQEHNPTYQTALAVAYMNIKRYDLAGQALNRAEESGPATPQLWRLRQRLEALIETK